MMTRRFNWIAVLVIGTTCLGIGALGLLAGQPSKTVVWFGIGAGFLVVSVILYRKHLE